MILEDLGLNEKRKTVVITVVSLSYLKSTQIKLLVDEEQTD